MSPHDPSHGQGIAQAGSAPFDPAQLMVSLRPRSGLRRAAAGATLKLSSMGGLDPPIQKMRRALLWMAGSEAGHGENWLCTITRFVLFHV